MYSAVTVLLSPTRCMEIFAHQPLDKTEANTINIIYVNAVLCAVYFAYFWNIVA